MMRDDLKHTDVKPLFQFLRLMADKIKTMYSCDFVNSKKWYFPYYGQMYFYIS